MPIQTVPLSQFSLHVKNFQWWERLKFLWNQPKCRAHLYDFFLLQKNNVLFISYNYYKSTIQSISHVVLVVPIKIQELAGA